MIGVLAMTAVLGKDLTASCADVVDGTVVIPPDADTIPASAFKGCAELKWIVLPAHVTAVGDKAFQNCAQLTTLSLLNPDVVLGKTVFSGVCPGILPSDIAGGACIRDCSPVPCACEREFDGATFGGEPIVPCFSSANVCEVRPPCHHVHSCR